MKSQSKFPDNETISDRSSNIARNTILGVFKSQVLRYARICSEFQDFLERLDIIVKKFMGLGFGKKLLKSHFVSLERKHNFLRKFGRVKDNVQNKVFNEDSEI